MSFAALVVVGDPASAVVATGFRKAKEVPQAIRRALKRAKKGPNPGVISRRPPDSLTCSLGRSAPAMVLNPFSLLKPARKARA